MKIALIIYLISWLVLIALYIVSFFVKNQSTREKHSWYLYACIIVFAPLVVLLLPYLIISPLIEKRKHKKYIAEQEEKSIAEKAYKQAAMNQFRNARINHTSNDSFIYIMSGETIMVHVRNKDYDALFKFLTTLSLPAGAKLFIEECEQKGMGDKSMVVVETPDGAYDLQIFDYINVEDTCEGAWEAYMLKKLWHVLPLWWHANYDRRTYIFSKDDFVKLEPYHKEQKKMIMEAIKEINCEPIIVKTSGKYYVCCCYWSDFGGLMQETVEITINNNKASFIDIDNHSLYEYNCGILF